MREKERKIDSYEEVNMIMYMCAREHYRQRTRRPVGQLVRPILIVYFLILKVLGRL